ncbi:MG406 family protein [Spiroplasma sp. BIUS-1]|uniref:MG406 family protein n=1 Tax=Spiroplasma sp. BIUS-1 TaxID=216964 RepID=UPI001397845C|nr:MG406 family protein [Spiroplasma sp. BIUS-1]QHX36300.1 hypothetical protein SBIUS_v1c00470 [Spiroplasma sp. BIUS-1]
MLLKNKRALIVISLISIILVLLSILTLFKVVDYTFITGYVLGTGFLYMAILFIALSTKNLTLNLNPYNFVFFSTIRIGFYIVPFLISFYLPIAFSIYGVLIAFIVNWMPFIFIRKSSK